MKRPHLRIPPLLAAIYVVGGCASIAGSHVDSISVKTPNCPGIPCVLKNDDGEYHIKETPGTVTVERAYGDLTVTCGNKRTGYESITVSSKAEGVWGNILLGGPIGWGIDAATGAGYAYPNSIINSLECKERKRKPIPRT